MEKQPTNFEYKTVVIYNHSLYPLLSKQSSESNATLFDEYLGVRGGYRVQPWDSSYPTRVQRLLVQPVDQFYKGPECYPVLRINEGRGDKGKLIHSWFHVTVISHWYVIYLSMIV